MFDNDLEFKLDIAFVLDATGSMAPFWESFARDINLLGEKLAAGLAKRNLTIKQLRVRAVDFSDFVSEADEAIRQTEFFTLPDDRAALEMYVQNVDYLKRGGDIPENALEALYTALDSDWTPVVRGERCRRVTVLVTDSYPLNLGERDGTIGYDVKAYPKDLNEFSDIWHGSSEQSNANFYHRHNRIVLIAPEGSDACGHSWDRFFDWDRTVTRLVKPERGCEEITVDEIVELIMEAMFSCY